LKTNNANQKAAFIMAAFFWMYFVGGGRAQSLVSIDESLSEVLPRISPAVVTVEARVPGARLPLSPEQRVRHSVPVRAMVGSGLLIDSLGHIITNLGIVDGRDEFKVGIYGTIADARLVGIDEPHRLAVLKVEGHYPHYIEVSPFPPAIGRIAVIFGRAPEQIPYLTLGIVAGRRSDESYLVSGSAWPGFLGGGVFDIYGRLIGFISSGDIDPEDRSGYPWGGVVMLPASVAMASADKIICCGNRRAGYLGIETVDIELVSATGQTAGQGVIVTRVEPYSPAAATGLREGDIITAFNHRNIAEQKELQRLVLETGSDSLVDIEYTRGHQNVIARVRLTSFPNDRKYVSTYDTKQTALKRRPFLPNDLIRRIDSLQLEIEGLHRQINRLLDENLSP